MLARWVACGGHGRRSRGHRADLCRPAGRGGSPGRRAGPRPAAGDDLGGRGRALVPVQGAAPGPGHGLVRDVVRRVRRAGRTSDTGVRMLPGTEVLAEPAADPGGPARCPTWTRVRRRRGTPTRGRSPRRSSTCRSTCAWLRARLDALGGTLTRMSLPRAADDRRRGGQLRRPRARGARRRPRRATGARPGGPGRRRRARPLVAGRGPVRPTSCRASDTSSSAAPTTTATGAGPVPRDGRPRSCTGRRGWCPSSPARTWSATGSACARCAPRCAWTRRTE